MIGSGTSSRVQMLEDGRLVAVEASLAAEAGFGVPVALTRAVFDDCVAWTDADAERTSVWLQDETGRLWDVLWMAAQAARRVRQRSRVTFELCRVPRDRGRIPIDDLEDAAYERLCRVRLVADIGPGDDGMPVITILQPQEAHQPGEQGDGGGEA